MAMLTHTDPHEAFVERDVSGDVAGELSPAEREAGLITFAELQQLPEAPWLIDGMIRQRSLTFLYGKPDTFKTFLALDLCGALMTGRAWLEAEVHQSGPVLYLAAEGTETLVERMAAWEIQHQATVPWDGFQVVQHPPELTDSDAIDTLCEGLKSRPYSLVVIDTFGKSLGWADENNNSEINRALLRAAKLKDLGLAVVPHPPHRAHRRSPARRVGHVRGGRHHHQGRRGGGPVGEAVL